MPDTPHDNPPSSKPAPFMPPVHYVSDDGVEFCVHTIPVGPDSCPHCRELADDEEPHCGAREPEPRTGTTQCVLSFGHGGRVHQDKWTNQWPMSKESVSSVVAPGCAGRVPPPSMPGAIEPSSQWCWEPLYPHLRSRVRITDTRWDGETWQVETEALDNSGRALAGQRRWVGLDNFIESAVAVDPVSEADYRKWRP